MAQPQPLPDVWRDIHLDYVHKGQHIQEDAYLTIDLEGNQIVVAPTLGLRLASQPKGNWNPGTLRAEAVKSWNDLCANTQKKKKNNRHRIIKLHDTILG